MKKKKNKETANKTAKLLIAKDLAAAHSVNGKQLVG